jgi:hypothetical protein
MAAMLGLCDCLSRKDSGKAVWKPGRNSNQSIMGALRRVPEIDPDRCRKATENCLEKADEVRNLADKAGSGSAKGWGKLA